MEGTSFSDILNDDQEVDAAPVVEETSETVGTGATEETQAEVTPTSETQEQGHIPIAALKDERAKRQALEDQSRQLQERLQQYEAFFAQQQGGQQHQEDPDPIEFINQQVMARMMPQIEMQMLTMKVEQTEAFARQKWQDYDEKVELFKEAAAANPYLVEELKRSPNPAEYAYNAAQKMHEARTYGTATPTREQVEAEIREKIMAEIGMQKPQAPTSLVNTQSRGSRGGPAWAGPASMDQILGG